MKTRSQTKHRKKKEKYSNKEDHSPKDDCKCVKIDTFNMQESIEEITHHPYITMIGQRFSGKSVLINGLVFHLDKKFKYKYIFCFSQTAKMATAFPWMKQECIFDTLDNLQEIVDIRKESGSKDPVLLVFDDIAGMTSMGANGKRKSIRYNETLEFLSTTARHFHFTVILSIQNRVLTSKTCRNNSSFSFIFTPKSHDDTTCIKNEYLGLCRSKTESDAMFDSIYGTPYMALVVEGWKSGVTKIHDYVKSYIAPFPMRKFKTKSLRKHNRDDKKKNKKKKGKNKNTHDLQVQLQFQNEEQLNFRLTNIYDSRQLNQEQDNTYEKSINIY